MARAYHEMATRATPASGHCWSSVHSQPVVLASAPPDCVEPGGGPAWRSVCTQSPPVSSSPLSVDEGKTEAMRCQSGLPAPWGTCCPASSAAPGAPPESGAGGQGPASRPPCEARSLHCRESGACQAAGLRSNEPSYQQNTHSERLPRSKKMYQWENREILCIKWPSYL